MYYVIGADGKMNGPLTVADVQRWIAEGRASKYSRVRREDEAAWQPLSSIPELLAQPERDPHPDPTADDRGAAAADPDSIDAIAASFLQRGVTLDAGRCVARAWTLVRANPALLIGAAVLVWTIVIGFTFVPRVGWAAGLLFNSALLGGLYSVNIRCIRGESVTVAGAFAGFRAAFGPLLVAGLLSGALTALGLLLLILPGLYLAVGYMFVLPLVIDKRMDVWTAMEVSRRVVHRQWWTTFALALVATLVVLAGTLAFGVGAVVAVPVATAALMYAYEDLFGE